MVCRLRAYESFLFTIYVWRCGEAGLLRIPSSGSSSPPLPSHRCVCVTFGHCGTMLSFLQFCEVHTQEPHNPFTRNDFSQTSQYICHFVLGHLHLCPGPDAAQGCKLDPPDSRRGSAPGHICRAQVLGASLCKQGPFGSLVRAHL